MSTPHRYPLAPLVALLRLPTPVLEPARGHDGFGPNHLPTSNQARELFGVGPARWHRFETEGLTLAEADEFAVRLGWDPYSVWPVMVDDVVAGVGAHTCEQCGAWFWPLPPNTDRARFCDDTCAYAAHIDKQRAVRAAARA